MTRLIARLAALEVHRPVVRQLADMTDAELVRIISGYTSTTITDAQLRRIAQGEPWINLKDA